MTQKPQPRIEESWAGALQEEFSRPYFAQLKSFLLEEKKQHRIYPPGAQIFAAFDQTPFDKVKVVILGQDPYHGPGQAHGLSFSVPEGIRQPPSLQNIFKELRDDIGCSLPQSGDLSPWARQGVLLLNAFLTVRHRQPGSHRDAGWQSFTDSVIERLSNHRQGLVFLLWGSFARSKKDLIDPERHHILEAPHPSPFSAHRGFFGCRHFSKTNALLQNQGRTPIQWQI